MDRVRIGTRDRLWLLLVLGAVAVALFPWAVYLSTTLPERHLAEHWDVAWVGFDLFLAGSLGLTAIALARRSPLLPLLAAVAGTALLCDAWFDVITAHPGSEQVQALAEALLIELPLAALCFWISARGARISEVSAAAPRPTARRAPRAAGTADPRASGSEAPSAGRTSR
jgi:hypothetical protein